MHWISPEKISPAHSYMLKSVHMHVKNFTYIASVIHVNFRFHMHDKIVSHVWKDFTWNKIYGKKVDTYDKTFSHVLQNFTCMSQSSHACEMLMWWTCVFANIDFTWFLFFTHFSHPFHMIFTHIALVVLNWKIYFQLPPSFPLFPRLFACFCYRWTFLWRFFVFFHSFSYFHKQVICNN